MSLPSQSSIFKVNANYVYIFVLQSVLDAQKDGCAVQGHGANVSAHIQDGTVAVEESLVQHVLPEMQLVISLRSHLI